MCFDFNKRGVKLLACKYVLDLNVSLFGPSIPVCRTKIVSKGICSSRKDTKRKVTCGYL